MSAADALAEPVAPRDPAPPVRSTRTRLAGAAALLAGTEVLTRLLGVAFLVVAARSLGRGELGRLSAAQALTAFLLLLAAGTGAAARRRLVSRPDDGALLTAATLGSLLVVVAGAVLIVAAVLSAGVTSGGLAVLAALPGVAVAACVPQWALEAREKVRSLAATRVVLAIGSTGAGAAAAVLTRDASLVLLCSAAATTPGAAVCLTLLRRSGLNFAAASRAEVAAAIRSGAAFAANGLLTQVLIGADVLVLAVLVDRQETGSYAAAYRIVAASLTAAAALVTAVAPELQRRGERGTTQVRPLLRRLTALVAWVTFPLAALVIVCADAVAGLLLGGDFMSSAPLLATLALFVPLAYHDSLVAQTLVALGHQRDYLRLNACAAATMLVLLFVTVPLAAGQGAAWTNVAVEAMLTVGLDLLARRRLGFSCLNVLPGPVLLGAGIAFAGGVLDLARDRPAQAGVLLAGSAVVGVLAAAAWPFRGSGGGG